MQYVCKECFADKELKGLILSQNKVGDCDCCASEAVEIITLDELLDFFVELFDNFQPDSTGESLLSLIQEKWNFFSNLDYGRKILNSTLNKIGHSFTYADDLVNFSADILENINYWFKLKEQLKWERRFIANTEYLTYDLGWDAFFESKVTIRREDVFYRARLHQNADEPVFERKDMYAPPKKLSTAGRANSPGIPYLYLCDNEDTILYEVRASYLDEITVATFSKKAEVEDEIIISDFTEATALYQPGNINKRIKSTLLKHLISRDLSKPLRRYDSELDYIPTQFICEFIKVFTNVNGIKFRSSLHDTGNNLVLFNQEMMECTSVKKVQIKEVNIQSGEI